LDNANKYSPQAPQITVSSWEEEGWLAISITDKGQGISKANQEKIFERFFRVSTGNLHDVKGFGLGLSYVKEIVEAHGGILSLDSKLGEGSTFIVRLPK
jgi:two-component system phosphate regulon sensor histidine kinase PhoR